MNVFQLLGDLLHLLSFIIIIYKLKKEKSCNGISCKTQELYLLVFSARYLDLFFRFISIYNTTMKVLFISVTIFIIYLMRFQTPLKNTYNRQTEDDFPHYYLIPFSLVLTLFIHKSWKITEFLLSFSLWLEAVAVFPQITILSKNKGVERFTAHYLAALGSYRFLYIFHWIYLYATTKYYLMVSILSGILQVLLYADFFYLYVKNFTGKFVSDLPISNINKETKEHNIKE